MSVYTDYGYENRVDYLNDLAENYGEDVVYALADILGPNEDFDGLVNSLEDYEAWKSFMVLDLTKKMSKMV